MNKYEISEGQSYVTKGFGVVISVGFNLNFYVWNQEGNVCPSYSKHLLSGSISFVSLRRLPLLPRPLYTCTFEATLYLVGLTNALWVNLIVGKYVESRRIWLCSYVYAFLFVCTWHGLTTVFDLFVYISVNKEPIF